MSDDLLDVRRKVKKHLFRAHDGVNAATQEVRQSGNLGHVRKEIRKEAATLRVEVDQLLVILRDRDEPRDGRDRLAGSSTH
jgi:hypothetical protein